jgi:hypothetical protein
VEAGGVWHCPNALCTVTGAFNAKKDAGLIGKDNTVDPAKVAEWGREWIKTQTDPAIIEAAQRSLAAWEAMSVEPPPAPTPPQPSLADAVCAEIEKAVTGPSLFQAHYPSMVTDWGELSGFEKTRWEVTARLCLTACLARVRALIEAREKEQQEERWKLRDENEAECLRLSMREQQEREDLRGRARFLEDLSEKLGKERDRTVEENIRLGLELQQMKKALAAERERVVAAMEVMKEEDYRWHCDRDGHNAKVDIFHSTIDRCIAIAKGGGA